MATTIGSIYETDVTSTLTGRRQTWTGVSGLSGVRKEMTDEVTQRFQARSALGEIIVNPMRSFQVGISCTGDQATARSTNYSYGTKYAYWEWQGCGIALKEGAIAPTWQPPYRVADERDTTRVVDETVTKLWAESAQSNANLFVGLAELGETIAMLREPLSQLGNLIDRKILKTYGRKAAKRVTVKQTRDAVMGSWMEIRYGWRPLVYEILGVLKALEEKENRVRAFYRASTRKSFSASSDITHSYGSWSTTYRKTTTEEVVCRAGMIMEDSVSLSRRLGLDLSGLLVVPWEVIPASFVLDWIANVGTWLQAVGAYAAREPLSSWYTMEKVITTSFVPIATTPVSGRLIVSPASDYMTVTLTEKARVRHVGPPRLTLKADLTQVKSVLHTIDLGIILKQKVKLR